MKSTNTDLANFSDANMPDKMIAAGISEPVVEQWKLLMNTARQSKYAFGGLSENLEEVYEATVNVAEELIK